MKENESDVNRKMNEMLLAGDIGGTKTLVGLFEPTSPRPTLALRRDYPSADYPDLAAVLAEFFALPLAQSAEVGSACFGVAGPVIGDGARLTNLPWIVEGRTLAQRFQLKRVTLLNDLQALAYAVPVLEEPELSSLQGGTPTKDGNAALIAAGTGLGEALLHQVDGRWIPSPSEGGHADFAARTEREITVLRDLIARHGRAQVEDVVSGPGLVNIHRITHDAASTHETRCQALANRNDPDAPSLISAAALTGQCAACGEALALFVEAYGAEAGNLALRTVSTAGLFIGGGIAPKVLPALQTGAFMDAFRAKAPLSDMLARIPVRVILNAQAGLVGAAVRAAM